MSRRSRVALGFFALSVACGAGCDSGWELEGYVVPEEGVDLSRQVVVLLSTDVELHLGDPSAEGFTKRARVLTTAEQMSPDGVRFQFFNVGCDFEKFQVVAIAPKTRVALPNRSGTPAEPVRLVTGDYLARTALLDVTECGFRGTQRITVPLTATEWAPSATPAPPAP